MGKQLTYSASLSCAAVSDNWEIKASLSSCKRNKIVIRVSKKVMSHIYLRLSEAKR